jgi:hypothetical protein
MKGDDMVDLSRLCPVATSGRNSVFSYNTDEPLVNLVKPGYFNDAYNVLEKGSIILISSPGGTVNTIVSHKENGNITVRLPFQAVLEGEIASNATVTRAEIETALEEYDIVLPLEASASFVMHDASGNPDKSFFVAYDKIIDTWYHVKMTPSS